MYKTFLDKCICRGDQQSHRTGHPERDSSCPEYNCSWKQNSSYHLDDKTLINKLGEKGESITTCHLSKERVHLDVDTWISRVQKTLLWTALSYTSYLHTPHLSLVRCFNTHIWTYKPMDFALQKCAQFVMSKSLHWSSKTLYYFYSWAVSLWWNCRIYLITCVSWDRRAPLGCSDAGHSYMLRIGRACVQMR